MHCTASAAEVLVGGSDSSALRFMLGRARTRARAQPLASIANAAWGRGGARVWGDPGKKCEALDTLSRSEGINDELINYLISFIE